MNRSIFRIIPIFFLFIFIGSHSLYALTQEEMDIEVEKKIVFSIERSKEHFSHEKKEDIDGDRHRYWIGCKLHVKVQNNTNLKVKINNFDLFTTKTELFGKNQFHQGVTVNRLLKPGEEKIDSIFGTTIDKVFHIESGKEPFNKDKLDELKNKYNCEKIKSTVIAKGDLNAIKFAKTAKIPSSDLPSYLKIKENDEYLIKLDF
jgi:hypothetical protein